MTEKISNAIITFNQLLFLGRVSMAKEEIESNIKTAISSLNAWSEVLEELEEEKLYPHCDYFKDGIDYAIDIINYHLAEIKE